MLDILAPTHLVLQGKAARTTAGEALSVRLEVDDAVDVMLNGHPMRAISLHHPTSQGSTNWSGPNRDYFRNTVVKLLSPS